MTSRLPLLAALAAAACSSETASVGRGYAPVLHTFSDPIRDLDVLFVVDDSGSMADDQRALVEAARTQLFAQLAAQPDGMPNLHLAVVSSSVAVPHIPNCDAAPDGLFASCPQIAGTYLIDVDDGAGGRTRNYTGTLDDAFACAAMLGDQGCGLERPFDALHRALDGSHAENAGFLRDDAVLLIVFLTDEDDGSVHDLYPYDFSRADDPFESNSRGFEYGVVCDPDDDSLGPRTDCHAREDSPYMVSVADTVAFLQHLKPDPAMVMVAGIVPPSDPVEVINNFNGSQREIGPACIPPPGPCADDPNQLCDRAGAAPAIRIHELLDQFTTRYTFSSLCEDTMNLRVYRIARSANAIMSNVPCLAIDHAVSADQCRAFEVTAGGDRTRIPLDLVEDPTACDFTPTHLRAVTDTPAAGHHVEIECVQ
ncbi:MAG TPA: hypothetical protein VL463_10030 [Kofleriaceae bacterium]|nr:hypothetical protein [Kofleriaceae bacterium]